MNYVVYKRPAVDQNYKDYSWNRHDGPYDDRDEAREEMPSRNSPIRKEYIFTVVPFGDDEEIPSSMDDGEKQSRIMKHR